jgi:hypothetical protein
MYKDGMPTNQSNKRRGKRASAKETGFLLRNPVNAKPLLESIAELNVGKGQERALAE